MAIEKAESLPFDIIIVLPKIKQTEVPALSTSITQNDYDSAEISGSISTFFKRFHVASLLKASNIHKEKGTSPARILEYMFTLIFKGKSMYMDHLMNPSDESACPKDAVYRFMKNGAANWNRFTSQLASKIAETVITPADSKDRVNALIVDDSVFSRNRSKKVELLTKIFDHAHHEYLFGFRMLTVSWTDGSTLLPVAGSLLSSENQKARINEAHETDHRSNAYKRRKLSLTKGTDAMIELIKEVKKAKLPADYVLFDSWFSSPKTLLALKDLGYDVIAMVKKSDKMKFEYNGEMKSVKEIYRMNHKRRGRSKYLLSVTVNVTRNGKSIPARIVFVRNRSNRKDYLCLISTNTDIDEDEIIRIYGKRWQIEVFFKVCKSYLGLASECRSLSYDAMSAHVAVVFARYMLLAVENRESEDPRTLGELFLYFTDELADITFAQAFKQIMEMFRAEMKDRFDLDESTISEMMDKFISVLRPSTQRQLKAA